MANYITECDFSIESNQLLLKFIIEPFGRCYRPGNYQIHEMNDGALFIFWNQGLLVNEEMDIIRKVVHGAENLGKHEKWEAFVDLANTITSNCDTRESHNFLLARC